MEAIWACSCDELLAGEAALKLVCVCKYVRAQSDRKGSQLTLGVGETSWGPWCQHYIRSVLAMWSGYLLEFHCICVGSCYVGNFLCPLLHRSWIQPYLRTTVLYLSERISALIVVLMHQALCLPVSLFRINLLSICVLLYTLARQTHARYLTADAKLSQ